ncbi:transposable element Tcb1 transposase [Trichonephila clavipes]|nr:transposable element Tcb1 transposase [Trichonephila clavipes]
MTVHIYRDVILEQHVRLFRGAMSAEFLFMYDNVHPHRANIVDECLQSEDITPTRGLLSTDHVILNHGQVTWTTPELAPSSPNYHTTPTGGRFSSRQIERASLPKGNRLFGGQTSSVAVQAELFCPF